MAFIPPRAFVLLPYNFRTHTHTTKFASIDISKYHKFRVSGLHHINKLK